MKNSLRALLTALLAGGLVAPTAADDNTAVLPGSVLKTAPKAAAPARATTALAEVSAEPVTSPEAGVTRQDNVNIRAQAAINSEVLGRLKKGDTVTIHELVTVKKPKADEPARWFRIALPTNMAVWVHSSFIDDATKAVKPARLNMRGGPGENYSIVGRLERGATVSVLETKEEWLKISPANAFGFVAAHLVERSPAPAIVEKTPTETPAQPPTTPPAPPVTPEPVTPPPTVAEVATTTPAVAPAEAVTPAVPPTTPTPTPAPAEAPAPTPVPMPNELPQEPIEKVRKIVSREGILRGSVSIQAPTYFELRSLDTGKAINYVFSPSTNLMLREFKGQRILVTGEEVLDERWQHTPVLIIDELQAVR